METLDIPSSMIGCKTGFTFDYGSSVIKFIYVTDIGNDKVRLHFVSYQHEDLEKGLELIKEKVGGSLTPGQEIVITGVGLNERIEQIESKLNIRVKQLLGTGFYGDGLSFLLKNFPLHEVVFPLSSKVKEFARTVGKQWADALKNISKSCGDKMNVPECLDTIDKIDLELSKTEKVTFPIIVMLVGSCTAPFRVYDDGSFDLLHVNPISGRTLLGLGAMMTDTKSFDEIQDVASKGNPKHMNRHLDSIVGESEGSKYDVMKIDLNLFSMAECIGKNLDDFSQADRAAGVVSLISTSTAMYMFAWAKALKAEHIFIIGSLAPSSEFIRDEIAKNFAWQSVSDQMDFHPKPLFVKLGAYVAALGALLANNKPQRI